MCWAWPGQGSLCVPASCQAIRRSQSWIRLPEHFAARLWGLSKIGARVIIARDEVAPVAIVHPRLPVPKKLAE